MIADYPTSFSGLAPRECPQIIAGTTLKLARVPLIKRSVGPARDWEFAVEDMKICYRTYLSTRLLICVANRAWSCYQVFYVFPTFSIYLVRGFRIANVGIK